MDIVTRKELMVLIGVAKSDQDFDDKEKSLIYKIAGEKGVSQSEVDELIQSTEPIGTLGALSSSQKFDYLENAVKIVSADGKVLDSELLFCEGLAIKMGLKKDVVSIFLDPELKDEDERWKAFRAQL